MSIKLYQSILRISIVLVFFILHSFCQAQEEYKFTPPQTVYAQVFKNIKKNNYNQKILKHIGNCQPIYVNGTLINTDSNYIAEHINAYNNTYQLNYFTKKYIKTYAQEENIMCAATIFNYYAPLITKNINTNNLPEIFKYIPLVCSGFTPTSNNLNGGLGYWHLNYVPAVKYGLTINKYIDERKDFKKSTIAAAKYLQHLYLLYQDWELTIAAYSCGVTTVNKLLLRTESSTFWEIYPYLPKETRDLVPALTAMVYCYSEAGNDNFLLSPIAPLNDTILIPRKLQFKAIEAVIKTTAKELSFLNPILNNTIFPDSFLAIFPEGTHSKFLEMEDSIYFYQDSVLLKPTPLSQKVSIPKDGEPFIYTVRSGDVLGVIASRFNVRVSQIQDWNDLIGTRINVGQKLTLYGKKKKKSKETLPIVIENTPIIQDSSPTKTPITTAEHTMYIVKSGDSLWLIAKKYKGVSAQNIMDLNKIGENLDVGQELMIPKR